MGTTAILDNSIMAVSKMTEIPLDVNNQMVTNYVRIGGEL